MPCLLPTPSEKQNNSLVTWQSDDPMITLNLYGKVDVFYENGDRINNKYNSHSNSSQASSFSKSIEIGSREVSRNSYIKLSLPCPFCLKLIKDKLSRHTLTVHSQDAEVKTAFKASARKKARITTKFRRQEIYKHNIGIIKGGSRKIMMEKKSKRTNVQDPTKVSTMCQKCKGFYTSKYFSIDTQMRGRNTKKKPNQKSAVLVFTTI